MDFVPIAVAETPPAQAVAPPLEKAAGDAGPAEIEVELPGATVRLRGSVDGKALMAVLTALKVLR